MSPRITKAPVARTIDTLTFKKTYDDDLPILHPTTITSNADIWLKVTSNGVPQARIPLHKEHVGQNIPFFGKMFEHSTFRESATQEIIFESEYKAEVICKYLGSVYSRVLVLTNTNCIGFCGLADYLGDDNGIEACKQHLKDYDIGVSKALLLMWRSRSYDDICIDYIKDNGLNDIEEYSEEIGKLGYDAFVKLAKNEDATKKLSPSTELRLIQIWFKANPKCTNFEEFVLAKDFSKYDVALKLAFYGDLFTEMSQRMYKHIFDEPTVEKAVVKTRYSTTKILNEFLNREFVIHRQLDDQVLQVYYLSSKKIEKGDGLQFYWDRKVNPKDKKKKRDTEHVIHVDISDRQRFTLYSHRGDNYSIRWAPSSRLCVDLIGGPKQNGHQNGHNVQLWDHVGGSNQNLQVIDWYIDEQGTRYFRLKFEIASEKHLALGGIRRGEVWDCSQNRKSEWLRFELI